jgi:ribose 5-phosphate isomerase
LDNSGNGKGLSQMTQDEMKTLVGQAALQYVVRGDIVGVGTGSTVNKFIDALVSLRGEIKGAVSSSVLATERLRASRCSTPMTLVSLRFTSTALMKLTVRAT